MLISAFLFFFTGLVIYIKMSGSQICDRLPPSSARGAHSPLGSSHRSEEKVRFYEVSKMRFKVRDSAVANVLSTLSEVDTTAIYLHAVKELCIMQQLDFLFSIFRHTECV